MKAFGVDHRNISDNVELHVPTMPQRLSFFATRLSTDGVEMREQKVEVQVKCPVVPQGG